MDVAGLKQDIKHTIKIWSGRSIRPNAAIVSYSHDRLTLLRPKWLLGFSDCNNVLRVFQLLIKTIQNSKSNKKKIKTKMFKKENLHPEGERQN